LNVRINVSPFRFVLCALALSVWSAPAFSQRVERGFEEKTVHSGTAESNATEHSDVKTHHDSSVQDWTHDHVLYPRIGPMNRLIELQKDPRAIQHWQESYRKDYVRWRGRERHRGEHRNRSYMHRDWNIFVGGMVGDAMYPAKWTFDSNESLAGAGPDAGACTTDYLAVPINPNQPGFPAGPGQPNVVGLNNLYSGTAPGPTGVCNRTAVAADNGVSATTYFSYAVIGDDGVVTTSPVPSMDGTKIAFVEGTTTGAHFHVLAWNAGDGNNDVANRQDPLTNTLQICAQPPVAPCTGTQGFVLVEPTITGGHGNATDLALGAIDSFSSPYVEYSDDVAYVGNDAGQIYKIKNVFCPAWAPCGTAAPSLDVTWGAGGVLSIGATCQLTGITVDGASGNIFAGCSDGNLYAFTPTGTAVPGSPLSIGDGTFPYGTLNDPPVLDVVNGWVYEEAMSSSATLAPAGTPILVQASVNNLNTNSVATLGTAATQSFFAMHAPAFNDAYFTGANPPLLYEYSSDTGGGGEIVLYGIGFSNIPATMTMNAGPPPAADTDAYVGLGAFEISPLAEFFTTGGEDRLFASANGLTSNNVVSFQINNFGVHADGFPDQSIPTTQGIESSATEVVGTSGIVVDNTSSAVGQANSIYYGVLGTTGANAYSVVKLTQAALQ
jgi:hypothetical protein